MKIYTVRIVSEFFIAAQWYSPLFTGVRQAPGATERFMAHLKLRWLAALRPLTLLGLRSLHKTNHITLMSNPTGDLKHTYMYVFETTLEGRCQINTKPTSSVCWKSRFGRRESNLVTQHGQGAFPQSLHPSTPHPSPAHLSTYCASVCKQSGE